VNKRAVKVGKLEYEAEELSEKTLPGAVDFAHIEILEYARERWQYSEEKREYQPANLKERRELSFLNNLVEQMVPIIAADKNGAVESVGQLFDLARNDAAGFDKLYQAAIVANPTLNPAPPEVPEVGPDPLGE
jgi:hypothetical protein